MNNKKYLYLLLFIIPIIVFFVEKSFSITYTEEIRNVEIESNDYDNPGSWHIDKSAEWTGFGKARVTFDVNSVLKTKDGRYKDVILVIDISGSMIGEKLDRAKQDAIDLTNYLLSDTHNSIALITFESTSQIISNFIKDKNIMFNYLNGLNASGCTNYNAGLLNVDEIMNSYTRDVNKDLVVLFLTDGYPNEDTPNEKATYGMLKDKYPYMTINGVQYEMGKDIIQDIIDISDNQWVADQDILHNVLFDAAVAPLVYDNFVLTDYINDEYFYLTSVDNIKVDIGDVTLTEENSVQKIVWNLGNSYKTSDNIKMTIDLDLKEEYHNTKGYYPTNKSESIKSRLPNEDEKTINSTLTPVLKNVYNVIYDTNTPDDCTLPTYDPEEHYVYQNVTKKTENLVCPGYLFKGWVIDDNDKTDMTIINDDMFVMPGHDVHLIAVWTSPNLVKTMDGEVHVRMTLYKVLQNEANAGTYAKRYTGSHQDSYDNSGTSDIYYYYANSQANAETIIKEKNNVIFANHCWQMIRTTDTGGVKMIYNGESKNDKCLNTRGNHVGYSNPTTLSLSGTYYYGTDYIYDKANNNFKVSGTTSYVEVTSSNASTVIPTLKGKYTCKNTSVDGTCLTIYLVDDYSSSTSSYVIPINISSNYSQFGILQFNQNYKSPADFGYMYNTRYAYNTKTMTTDESMYYVGSINTSYWYAPSINWGSPVANKYNLVDAYQVTSSSDYPNLVGKYTFTSFLQTYTDSSVYYIVGVDGSTMYYIKLGNESGTTHDLSYYNYRYTYGDSYIDNLDGTYTIKNTDGTNPGTISRIDWYTDYSNMGTNKYVCKNAVNNTCNELWYVTTNKSNNRMTYIKVSNVYKYAKDFEYKIDPNDGTYKYFLKDDNNGSISFWNINDSTNKANLNTYHYTCWNESGVCTQISYVYYLDGIVPFYITIKDGKDVNDALEEMLSLDNNSYHVNTINSTMKTGVDAWYKKYIYDEFDDYIEDTIYCNDRSIRAKNGWDSNGGSVSNFLEFKEYSTTSDLSCTNETDRFSTLNNKAKLTYKVGLATSPEMKILGSQYLRKTGQNYWLMSPFYFAYYYASERYIGDLGGMNGNGVNYILGVRPVVSLIPGIEYVSGDGSMESPYRVDDGTI